MSKTLIFLIFLIVTLFLSTFSVKLKTKTETAMLIRSQMGVSTKSTTKEKQESDSGENSNINKVSLDEEPAKEINALVEKHDDELDSNYNNSQA